MLSLFYIPISLSALKGVELYAILGVFIVEDCKFNKSCYGWRVNRFIQDKCNKRKKIFPYKFKTKEDCMNGLRLKFNSYKKRADYCMRVNGTIKNCFGGTEGKRRHIQRDKHKVKQVGTAQKIIINKDKTEIKNTSFDW